jgi:hypothetical protein
MDYGVCHACISRFLASASALCLVIASPAVAQVFPRTLGPLDLDGGNGFNLDLGYAMGTTRSNPVAIIPDVNGDGIAAMIIGHPFDTEFTNSNEDGAAYVIFGKPAAGSGGAVFAANFDVATIDGSEGIALIGAADGTEFGTTVASAGDFNNDGIDDVVIGALTGRNRSGDITGTAYVFYGHTGVFGADFSAADLNGGNGFVMNGVTEDDRFGEALASAGDINNDGFDDIVIGAPNSSASGINGSGHAYVIFGHDNTAAAAFDASALNGTNGFVLPGVSSFDRMGKAVASAGDFDGDGVDDLLVSAYWASGMDENGNSMSGAGMSYVLFGHAGPFASTFDIGTLNGVNGLAISGVDFDDNTGFSAHLAGDVNKDGYDDVIISSTTADAGDGTNAGSAYVVMGHPTPDGPVFRLATLDGNNGFMVQGAATENEFGSALGGGHDINGDGVDDIVIGREVRQIASVVFGIDEPTGPTTLFSSILPSARSGAVGGVPITVFGSVINAGTNRENNCQITIPPSEVSLNYQTTNAANVLVGQPDRPFSIHAGETKSFVLAFDPLATTFASEVFPNFVCDQSDVDEISGVNTVFFHITDTPQADILSISATPIFVDHFHLYW